MLKHPRVRWLAQRIRVTCFLTSMSKKILNLIETCWVPYAFLEKIAPNYLFMLCLLLVHCI